MYHAKLGELLLAAGDDKNNLGHVLLDGKEWETFVDQTHRLVHFHPKGYYNFFYSANKPKQEEQSIVFSEYLDLYIAEDTGETPYSDITKDVDGKPHKFVFKNKDGGPLTADDARTRR